MQAVTKLPDKDGTVQCDEQTMTRSTPEPRMKRASKINIRELNYKRFV